MFKQFVINKMCYQSKCLVINYNKWSLLDKCIINHKMYNTTH